MSGGRFQNANRPRGYRLKAEEDWNTLVRRVNHLDAPTKNGSWTDSISTGGFSASKASRAGHHIRLLEMYETMGPELTTEFRDREAKHVYWDATTLEWKKNEDAEIVQVVTDPYYNLPMDAGDRFLGIFHQQSGKYLPLAKVTTRLVKTCVDGSGFYPEASDVPRCYPISHVTSSYNVTSTANGAATVTHTVFSGGNGVPHGQTDEQASVYNLAEGAYIPVGTVIPAFFINSQWWTYYSANTNRLAMATLQYDLCGATATITDFEMLDGTTLASPPTTAKNGPIVGGKKLFQHRGLIGDTVLLAYHQELAQWIVINVTKHEYDLYVGMRRTGDCSSFCIEADVIRASIEVCSTALTHVVFCYPCNDSSLQTSIEQTSFAQTSNTQTSTIGCGDGEIDPTLLNGTENQLVIQEGSTPETAVRRVSVTITNQAGCGHDVGTPGDWDVKTPRTNDVYQPFTSPNGYESIVTNLLAYDPDGGSYQQGAYESYFLYCRQRADVITGVTINSGDPTDVEWVLEGVYGVPTLGLGLGGSSVRISETQGGAVDVLDGGTWVSMPGTLTILSFAPFHAVAVFTPPGWYPYSLQDTTCGPVMVEFMEVI